MRAASFRVGVFILLLPAGNVFAQTVNVDWWTKAPFGDYQTYAWKDSDNQGARYYRQWVKKDVDTELVEKDFQKVTVVQNPSVYVYYYYVATQQTADSPPGDNRFGWLVAPLSFRPDWSGWGEDIGTLPDIAQIPGKPHNTGVLVIGIVDAMKKTLVWRAQAIDAISNSHKKEETKVLKSIDKMFKQFPPNEK